MDDKFKFARLVSWITAKMPDNQALDQQEIGELDFLTQAEPAPVVVPPHSEMVRNDVNMLFHAMKDGRKIDAIRFHRKLTGYALKESKDEIESVIGRNSKPYTPVEPKIVDILKESSYSEFVNKCADWPNGFSASDYKHGVITMRDEARVLNGTNV